MIWGAAFAIVTLQLKLDLDDVSHWNTGISLSLLKKVLYESKVIVQEYPPLSSGNSDLDTDISPEESVFSITSRILFDEEYLACVPMSLSL
jgi:hypothetical protein